MHTSLLFALILLVCGTNGAPRSLVIRPLQVEESPSVRVTRQVKSPSEPSVYEFSVVSDIQTRYAHTTVSSRVANPANISQEIGFTVVISDSAFISGFLMEIKDKVYKAYVKEKNEAKKEYNEAVASGQSAGHVAVSARNSNEFSVSVNVEAHGKVTFNLTYEELLQRTRGFYRHTININPGQIVDDLLVEININESRKLTKLKVEPLRNSLDDTETVETLTRITRPDPRSAHLIYRPTQKQQEEASEDGVHGQYVVQYDVERTQDGGEIQLADGYFVHFFAPKDLPPLNKHIVFVLDTSGSMSGRRIEQLKEAMVSILEELREGDRFSILEFNDNVLPWTTDAGIYNEVNQKNIDDAQTYINGLSAGGGTNIHSALLKAMEVLKETTLTPVIVFLTDGEPTSGVTDTNTIINDVSSENHQDAPLYSLALGSRTDYGFLKKLSLRNQGFSRKIYEASDTSLQLRDFYTEISTPLLSKVNFTYVDGVDDASLTKTNFRALYGGSELVVAGRLHEGAGERVTVRGHGADADDTMEFHCIIPPFPRPLPLPQPQPPRPETKQGTLANIIERLWAYLTIKNLLKEKEALDDNDKSQEVEEKALKLALDYSFVTPLTSLVVVKPNETVIGTEKPADDFDSDTAGFGIMPMSSFAPAASFAGGLHSQSFGIGQFSITSGGGSPLYSQSSPTFNKVDNRRRPAIIPLRRPTAAHYTTTTHRPITTHRPTTLRTTTVNPLSHLLTWYLSDKVTQGQVTVTTPNTIGDLTATILSHPPTDRGQNCTTHVGLDGRCAHIMDCLQGGVDTDYNIFLANFCWMDDRFAGVCCPH